MEFTKNQQDFMRLLIQLGVFDVKQGSVQLTVNFDALGNIGSVEATTKQHYRI